MRDPNGDGPELLTGAQMLLAQTEEALRRLLFEVRPPALEVSGGFVETVRDRVQMLKSLTGAEVELELDLPDDLSYGDGSMLLGQITEALTYIEKYASATRVCVAINDDDTSM